MIDQSNPISATRLAHCPPEAAFEWLKNHASGGEQPNLNDPLLEYVLYRRKDPYIDLGLALYATNSKIVYRIFKRGSVGVRCAALKNATLAEGRSEKIGWLGKADSNRIIAEEGKELEALAANPHLEDSVYRDMMLCENKFSTLRPEAHRRILTVLSTNSRFDKPHDSQNHLYSDPMLRAFEARSRALPWEVARQIPVNRASAKAVWRLVYKVGPPNIRIRDIDAILARWTPENVEEDAYALGYFDLRTKLADAKPADNELLNSPDSALRLSFYARFDPSKYPEWNKKACQEKDWIVVAALLDNKALWRKGEETDRLYELCTKWGSESDHEILMPCFFDKRREMQQSKPEWFELKRKSELQEFREEVSRSQSNILKKIRGIDKAIENIEKISKGDTLTQRTNSIYIAGMQKKIHQMSTEIETLFKRSEALSNKLAPLQTNNYDEISGIANIIATIRKRLARSDPEQEFGARFHTGLIAVISGLVMLPIFYLDQIIAPLFVEPTVRNIATAFVNLIGWLGGAFLMVAAVMAGLLCLKNAPLRRLSYIVFNIASIGIASFLAWPRSFDVTSSYGLTEVGEYASTYGISLSALYGLVVVTIISGLFIWRGIHIIDD